MVQVSEGAPLPVARVSLELPFILNFDILDRLPLAVFPLAVFRLFLIVGGDRDGLGPCEEVRHFLPREELHEAQGLVDEGEDFCFSAEFSLPLFIGNPLVQSVLVVLVEVVDFEEIGAEVVLFLDPIILKLDEVGVLQQLPALNGLEEESLRRRLHYRLLEDMQGLRRLMLDDRDFSVGVKFGSVFAYGFVMRARVKRRRVRCPHSNLVIILTHYAI